MSDPLQTALHHQRAGRLAEAAAIYQTLLRANPQRADALHLFGMLHHQAAQPQEGLKYLQRALALQPDNPAILTDAALVLQASGQPAEAEALCRRALAAAPDAVEARLNLGNLLKDRGDHAGAIAAYRAVLQVAPGNVAAQVNLGVALELAGDLEAALAAYRRGAELQPDLAVTHLNAGLALHKLHRFREAIAALQAALLRDGSLAVAHMAIGQCARELGDTALAYAAFQRAAKLAPDAPEVQDALSGLLSGQIPGWHFPMLADTARNEAFAAAIAKAVRPGMTVLDIGTGSGLLALLAARAGAARVIACEAHPLIAAAAQEIVARNGYADRIAVIGKRSTELDTATDLPEPADLLVAEVLDAGLIGEGMLPTTRDALKRLVKPGARILPAAARIVAQLMTLPQLRQVNPLRQLCGFDLSPFDRFRNRAAHGTVRLDHEPHQALSAVLPVHRIDFAAPPDWVVPQTLTLAVPATAAGTAQALVFWFELWLDDDIMLSTGPGGAMRHWGQAVCWLPEDKAVRPGDSLTFRVTLADTYFDFTPL